MKISNSFPSTYLRHSDLDGRDFVLTMDQIRMEKVGDDDKPVLYFQNANKGLVLNKTNANMVVSLYGDETTNWKGQRIVAFPTTTEYQSRTVDCIRLKAAPPAMPPAVHQELEDANAALAQDSYQAETPPLMRRDETPSDLDF